MLSGQYPFLNRVGLYFKATNEHYISLHKRLQTPEAS